MNVFTPAIATDEKAQKNVRDWIRALRSGKYEQGQGYVRSENGYCCLGVACDLLQPDDWSESRSFTPFTHPLSEDEILTLPARRRFSLSAEGQKALVNMNDGNEDSTPRVESVDFNAIAKRLAHDLRERLA